MWGCDYGQRRNKRRKYLDDDDDDHSTDSSENESKNETEASSMESEDYEPENETKFKSKVYGLLKNVTNCGKGGTEFAISGKLLQAPNMLISVKDDGIMRFPMYENETEKFIETFEKSPFGKGTETIVDPSVRNSWELNPSWFQIMNPQWETYLNEVLVPLMGKEFDISPTTFSVSLYKLLLYKTGSFFKVHRDSEKEDGMFGTLVVQLPSKYTGGQLVVNHDGKTKTIDFSSSDESNNEFEMFFSAFYCDCEHEILPLTSGIRVCLIYNLAITKTDVVASVPTAPRMTEIEGQVSSLLKNWEIHGGPPKIVCSLTHRYTEKNLSFENLKASDKIIAKTLLNLSRQNNLTLLIGIFKKESSGSSMGDTTSDFDSDDEDGYCDRTYTLSNLKLLDSKDAQNSPTVSSLSVDYENEVIPENCFKNRSPYHQTKEPTGNAGVLVSLFYRVAALVMFPSENIVQVYVDNNQLDSAATIFLNEFEKFRTSRNDVKIEAKLRKWLTLMLQKSYKSLPNVVPMLNAVIYFNDLKLLQNFLDRFTQINEGTIPLILSQCEKFGWSSLSAQLVNQFKNLGRYSTALKLLSLIVEGGLEKEKEEVCQKLAQEILELARKQKNSASCNYWGSTIAKPLAEKQKELEADKEFMFEFCQIAKKINFDVLDFAKTQTIRVVGPVLMKLSNEVDNTLDYYWHGLKAYVLKRLEEIAAKGLVVPTWRFTNYPSCGCTDCWVVNAFMKSDRVKEGFKMGKDRRFHIHQKLNGFDNITHETIREGNPQTLVLTKIVMPNLDETEERKLATDLTPKLKAMTHNPKNE